MLFKHGWNRSSPTTERGSIFISWHQIDRPGRGSTSQYFILAPKLPPNRGRGCICTGSIALIGGSIAQK